MLMPEMNAEIITPAIIEAVNNKYAPDCGDVEDIVSAYLDGYTDGYELAKELDDAYYWDMDLELAEWLDGISSIADRAYHQYLDQWAKLHNIILKYKPGDKVKYRGFEAVVSEIHKHRPLSYAIQYTGKTPYLSNAVVGSNCRQIVWFNDLKDADNE